MRVFLLSLLLAPLLVIGQVLKFRAVKTQLSEYNGKKFVTTERHDANFLVVWNLDNDKVQTYGNAFGDYDIVRKTRQWKDSALNTYAELQAIDSAGKKCLITLIIYGQRGITQNRDNGCIATLIVEYSEKGMLFFYLKKDE